MFKLPSLSIAAKLYTIFALLATVTTALALMAALNSRQKSALTDDFEKAFLGAQNVERVNGLVYAVVMESRGVYMSSDLTSGKRYGDLILKLNERIAQVVADWRKHVGSADAAQFAEFEKRIQQFMEFRKELARLGSEVSPAKGREWGDNEANRSVRTALNQDLDKLARIYDARSKQVYAEMEAGIARTAWLLGILAIVTLALAIAGIAIIWRAVARPLAAIAHVTEQVANGDTSIAVPYAERHDEVGALARSIGVFQSAMTRNAELNRTIAEEVKAREARNTHIENAVEAFRVSVEQSLSAVGKNAEIMRSTAQTLTGVASNAKDQTGSAAAASDDTATNVNTVASASEELTASIQEIARHVAASMTEIEKVTTAIASAVEEQGAATQEISRNANLAAQGTKTLAHNISTVNGAIGETTRSAGAVLDASLSLSSEATRLTEEVQNFFTALRGGSFERRVADDRDYGGPERRAERKPKAAA